MLFSVYLTVLEDKSDEEQFIDAYNTYKRLVYHTAYKVTGDPHLAEDVLQEVFLYVAKNISKIRWKNCHELTAYLVSCSRSRAYDRDHRKNLSGLGNPLKRLLEFLIFVNRAAKSRSPCRFPAW